LEKKSAIYIDGSNTYNKLKKLGLPDEDKRLISLRSFSYCWASGSSYRRDIMLEIVSEFTMILEKKREVVRKQQTISRDLALRRFRDSRKGKIMYDGWSHTRKGCGCKIGD